MQSLDSDNYLSFQGQGVWMQANKRLYGRNCNGRNRYTWFSTKFKVFGSLKWPPVTHRP